MRVPLPLPLAAASSSLPTDEAKAAVWGKKREEDARGPEEVRGAFAAVFGEASAAHLDAAAAKRPACSKASADLTIPKWSRRRPPVPRLHHDSKRAFCFPEAVLWFGHGAGLDGVDGGR